MMEYRPEVGGLTFGGRGGRGGGGGCVEAQVQVEGVWHLHPQARECPQSSQDFSLPEQVAQLFDH